METQQTKKGEIIFYGQDTSDFSVEVIPYEGEVWLTKEKIATLFGVGLEELEQVIPIGMKSSTSHVEKKEFSLCDVIYIGWQLHSKVAMQCQKYGCDIITSYLTKGFALNEEMIKNIGGNVYFHELKECIKDIESSQEIFYMKLLKLFSMSKDFDPKSQICEDFIYHTRMFLCYLISEKLPSELAMERINFDSRGFNMRQFTYETPYTTEILDCKSYFSKEELQQFNDVVHSYLKFAYEFASSRNVIYMDDWRNMIYEYFKVMKNCKEGVFLSQNERDVLDTNLEKYYKDRIKRGCSNRKEEEILSCIEKIETMMNE